MVTESAHVQKLLLRFSILTVGRAEREKKPILGPLVHNPQVVSGLAEHGIPIYERYLDLEELDEQSEVIITAHGYPKDLKADLDRRGIKFHDATCPVLLRWVYQR